MSEYPKLLDIQDISLLKITKVRDWVICFEYDNEQYLLHGCYECGEGSWQDLYQRKLNEYGKYDLTELNYKGHVAENVKHDYIKPQKGKTIVYSQIDKEYFVYKLTKRGFATGIAEPKVNDNNDLIKRLQSNLSYYEEVCRSLRTEIKKLS